MLEFNFWSPNKDIGKKKKVDDSKLLQLWNNAFAPSPKAGENSFAIRAVENSLLNFQLGSEG